MTVRQGDAAGFSNVLQDLHLVLRLLNGDGRMKDVERSTY